MRKEKGEGGGRKEEAAAGKKRKRKKRKKKKGKGKGKEGGGKRGGGGTGEGGGGEKNRSDLPGGNCFNGQIAENLYNWTEMLCVGSAHQQEKKGLCSKFVTSFMLHLILKS